MLKLLDEFEPFVSDLDATYVVIVVFVQFDLVYLVDGDDVLV